MGQQLGMPQQFGAAPTQVMQPQFAAPQQQFGMPQGMSRPMPQAMPQMMPQGMPQQMMQQPMMQQSMMQQPMMQQPMMQQPKTTVTFIRPGNDLIFSVSE